MRKKNKKKNLKLEKFQNAFLFHIFRINFMINALELLNYKNKIIEVKLKKF